MFVLNAVRLKFYFMFCNNSKGVSFTIIINLYTLLLLLRQIWKSCDCFRLLLVFIIFYIMKRTFKQWWITVPPVSIKTTNFLSPGINKKNNNPHDLPMLIHVLVLDRHRYMAELSWLKGSHIPLPDNLISSKGVT